MKDLRVNTKRKAKQIVRIIKKLEKFDIEVNEFIINENGKAENFIARSTADKRIGF